ncbi:MAG TPA: peptidoglycan-binding domain-containing protein [Blastocatellia bacterium]|nr:peptidoglycan-binding domain-containing protein [Blastocatellia bacterium]
MHNRTKGPAQLILTPVMILCFMIPTQAIEYSPIVSTPMVQTVLTSVDSIRAAQTVLRDRGYYNGPINGTMNFQTRNALRRFQQDRNLPVTGDLDLRTAQALGIASNTGDQAVLVEISNPRAERISRNSIRIMAEATTRSGGWRVYTDHFVSGDTLHVYVRGIPPRGPSTQAIDSHSIDTTIDDASGVSRAIFHGAQRDITVQISGVGGGSPIGVINSRQILATVDRLLTTFQRDLNLRGNRNSIIFGDRRNLRETEAEMLVYLTSLRAAADLFNQMAVGNSDTPALTGAVEALARQSRVINRFIRRSEAQLNLSSRFRSDWDQLRSDLSRINPSYGNFDDDIIR